MQNMVIHVGRLPITNDLVPLPAVEKKNIATISEAWSSEVGSFLIDLYPTLLDQGASIAELQMRSVIEALSHSEPSLGKFLDMMNHLGIDAEIVGGGDDEGSL